MMNKITTILIIISLTIGCRSSKFNENHGVVIDPIPNEIKKEITIVNLEHSTGVIFPKEYEPNFNKDRLSNRFTPTEQEIRNAEIEINNQYLESERRFIYNQVYKRTDEIYGNQKIDKEKEFESLMKHPIKEAKKSINFDRQYLGFKENGQKKLVIQFIDFSKDPYGLEKYLTENFIMGWHGWFETNVRLKEYNLETKRLNSFGWSNL